MSTLPRARQFASRTLVLLTLTAPGWTAITAGEDPDAQLTEHLTTALARQVEETGFQGSVLVAQGERALVRAAFGMADREQGIENKPETRFRIGSISKQFTAASVLRLVERGEVRLDDLAGEYWIDTPAEWSEITVEHLLRHTSGIFNVTNRRDFRQWQSRPHRPADLIRKVVDMPLDFAPGESWSYSNTGYLFLAQIVEHVTDTQFEAFLAAEVLAPLKLENSGSECLDAPVPGLAQGYRETEEGWATALPIDMNVPAGGGGMYSTIDDLWAWARAMMAREHLQPETWEAMLDPGLGDYGLGLWIQELDGTKRIQHGGGINGFASQLLILPEMDAVLVALSNYESSDPSALTYGLEEAFLTGSLAGLGK